MCNGFSHCPELPDHLCHKKFTLTLEYPITYAGFSFFLGTFTQQTESGSKSKGIFGLILGSSINLAILVTMVALWLACCLLDGEDQGLITPITNSFL